MEELKQALLRQRTMTERFRLPLDESAVSVLLRAAYEVEVELRHRQFVEDKFTLDNLCSVSSYMTKNNSSFGMMFAGKSGNGKSTMLNALANTIQMLVRSDKLGEYKGLLIVDARHVVLYSKNQKTFKELCDIPLLAIEDLGREPVEVVEYGNVFTPVIELLEYRYDKQLFTIVTTNLNRDEIPSRYGRRMADRFNEMFNKIVFRKEDSYRCITQNLD